MKRLLPLMLLLALLPILPGCLAVVAAGAAGGTVAYVEGKLTANVDATPEQIAQAIPLAAADLHLAILSASPTEVTARTAGDTKVKIYVTPVTPKSSQIVIRVGVFGDQAMSQSILDAIRTHLPK